MLSGRPLAPSRFQILRRIGEGGMGVVYEALDVERGVRVALKTILRHDADARARFKREFRALQDIHHPNLVALGELVAEADDVFFTMELVDGTDLLTYVRGGAAPSAPPLHDAKTRDAPRAGSRFDEARLRDAFRQIALGLNALHAAHKVHRDVKPSNVRITPEGRVVLLDFGLVLESDDAHAADPSMVGTPAYMAPEQAAAEDVGPAADWYAVGAMMYLCLAGRLPFEGSTMDVLAAKLVREPEPPSTYAPHVPRDLDALCCALLRLDKKERASGREVLERLDAAGRSAPSVLPADADAGSSPFVGRQRELVELERAFADVVAGRGVTVMLRGESGVGKSCLVKRFLESVVPGSEDVLVLSGRCYERESVPYKAFDEVIETLGRKLARLERDELLPLLPAHAEELARLFPALLRGALVTPSVGPPALDAHERRRHAFEAVREFFVRLARRHRLVLAIDDLQWTDADSLELLRDLLRPPDAPPILVVATLRTAASDDDARAAPFASLPGDVRVVTVDRLPPNDARELAAVLLRRAAPGAIDASAIASEAAGHPLFIDELVRHAAQASDGRAAALRLDDALAARVDRLDDDARRALETACVIGAPVAQETLAQAAGLQLGELTRAVAVLRSSNLLRTSGARVSDAIEPYHDRVREALVARMDAATARDRHARIAAAFEASRTFDPQVLATHWEEGGEPAKAAKYAIVAAEQAVGTLAFERAARLYDRALALLPADDSRRRALHRPLGDALANAGEAVRAAAEYERAASHAAPAEALDLRRRAAEQLLRAGETSRGIGATSTVLASVGMRMPRTALGALLALLWYRLVLRVRGLGFTPRDESEIPPTDLTRLDVCASLADTLSYADAVRGAAFHTRCLLLALRLGESRRIVRALCTEVAYVAAYGSKTWPRTLRLIERASDLAERTGSPEARARALGYAGVAYCINSRFAKAIDHLERGIALFRAEVPGSTWEVTTLRFFLFCAYAYSGRFAAQRHEHEAALKDAIARGDRYAAVVLRIGVLNRIWWMAGDPARARRELDEARRGAASAGRYDLVHFYQLVGDAYLDMYEGDGAQAHARVEAYWPTLRRSLLLSFEAVRIEGSALRARAALSAAADPNCPDREARLRTAQRALAALSGVDTPVLRSAALSLRVGLASLRGQPDEAQRLLQRMAADETEEGWMSRQLASWCLGERRGGIEGEAQIRAAKEALAARGVSPDARLLLVQFPGLGAGR